MRLSDIDEMNVREMER